LDRWFVIGVGIGFQVSLSIPTIDLQQGLGELSIKTRIGIGHRDRSALGQIQSLLD
jgi:hypothetical protein